ncbi:hypothetical protein EJH19_25580, partial [Salmonella enterica subsp. enterica serovar Vitkin]|nr:hypothetical protein [Salmonella enterica subsp. enterica serovar Vitkin]
TAHVIPDTVRVCADIRGIAGPQRCGGQFTPADAPDTVKDLTTEAQVTVDMPKLTVYLAPLDANGEAGHTDQTGRSTDDNVAIYHAVCQTFASGRKGPVISRQHGAPITYAFTRTDDMAPTRLTGSHSVPSDYNYEPGQRFVAATDPNIEDVPLQDPATINRPPQCATSPFGPFPDDNIAEWCYSVSL